MGNVDKTEKKLSSLTAAVINGRENSLEAFQYISATLDFFEASRRVKGGFRTSDGLVISDDLIKDDAVLVREIVGRHFDDVFIGSVYHRVCEYYEMYGF